MGIRCLLGAVAACGVGMVLLLVSCESTQVNTNIPIAPQSVDMTGSTSVVFTATDRALSEGAEASGGALPLQLPLVWRVSNPALGSIQGSGGLSAVYVSTGAAGQNTIMVRDQAEAEGVAAVNQF